MTMDTSADMLRPPINRSMKVLDRAFFNKIVPIAAARVSNNQHISQCRKELQSSGDLAFANLSRIHSVVPDPLPDLAQQGRRCLLLQDRIKADGMIAIYILLSVTNFTRQTRRRGLRL